ncbi:hypothetical protein SAICODRAFT_19607 [Saitoella complicata NRRL Y-17804]|uniref:Thioredoxin domain-containing protein n=1 Tax=Saitoella complicata (strain BCRC 22490 / CBS 7301 / JCM 7358 / NBRC 10748 / NRRL Y-17804) TaxID=698492 RepID=A0A0E9NKR1_SAICN|nr:uncharacterized protein SAICODRAFT_19607 [Saitoella complicata NRRL Y-17804]ODQ52824.1 hypothetical protein SAICODRAFT_19607 [Saitoella complicata NRRL Y-17804]GAO50424.1 hypothetical protein G7K_4550-t1 [Saitoella complicata NRRL Y-17804]
MNRSIRNTFEGIARRGFATSNVLQRVWTPVRSRTEFEAIQALTTANNVPLIANFTAFWCPTCKVTGPILEKVVEKISEQSRIDMVNVEVDAPEAAELMVMYQVRTLPTFVSFYRDRKEDSFVPGGHGSQSEQQIQDWVSMTARLGKGQ